MLLLYDSGAMKLCSLKKKTHNIADKTTKFVLLMVIAFFLLGKLFAGLECV